MDGVVTRKAQKDDCASVMDLIQEFAKYDPDGPKICQKTLEEDGFGKDPAFHCFVALQESKVIGYAISYLSYSTWEGRSIVLEDLYVQPSYQGIGIGSALLKEVTQYGLDLGCSRVNFYSLKSNYTALAFYKAKGAINLTEAEGWDLFEMNKKVMGQFIRE
ncbi:thialysine N-epsilon-acetyltransferase-like [Oratosquilla oratoria]|uniref:thialysine N-epsilon-acetyltransferase-like n=1 Tax=Oratosquilla oratoria TaxID=337810 RepID=UPI003F761104